jgi:A/G-specific adenine glycosylase
MEARPEDSIEAILAWYDRVGRRLPWRETVDPYEILVSEIMLQQTQVSRVIPYYQRWLARFPDWATLSAAEPAAVIQVWSGLGYNRRGLMLRQIAKQVCERGVPPKGEDEWHELKGIGPYTAAALTVFSGQGRAVPIDTNIRRVAGRWLAGLPYPEPKTSDDARLHSLLAEIIAGTPRYADLVQALFDLASIVCLKLPQCRVCPLHDPDTALCRAAHHWAEGVEPPPAPPTRTSRERRHRDKPHPDRIYRGRVLALITARHPHGLPEKGLGPDIDSSFAFQHDAAWLRAIIDRLCRDGLLQRHDGFLFLPGQTPRDLCPGDPS